MFRTSRIMRYINQNRKKLTVVIGGIICVIVVIQLLNSFAAKQNKVSSNENIANTQSSSVYNPNKTILTDTEIQEKQAKENTDIIDKFVKYCNNGKTQEAYDLLTEECKEELYPTLDKFYNNYYKNIFQKNKEYNIQSWMTTSNNYTYKIRYVDNILSTGQYNSSEILEDYITIVQKGDEVKLNIGYYVLRQQVNKKEEKEGIVINVLYKDVYMKYEKYTIQVENKTNNDILVDSLEEINGIKLFGENDVEYQALTNELSNYDVKVPSQNTKKLEIKFIKEYNPKRRSKKLIFSNIIKIDDSEVVETNTKTESSSTYKIEVKLM